MEPIAAVATPPMVSYAQNLEDVLLERVFHEVEHGFYVDVGANDPEHFSVTKHFHDRGWCGINIEPGAIFERLRHERPEDVNLRLAASDHCGVATFYEYTTPGTNGSSPLLPEVPPPLRGIRVRRVEHRVETSTLRAIFEHYAPAHIEFMSVDVEGHEREVLAGNDWEHFRPRVLLVEATLPNTTTPCHGRFEDVVLAARYRRAYFDGLNRWYVREEDAPLLERFATPVNVFDDYVSAEVDRLKALERTIGDLGTRAFAIGLAVARLVRRSHLAYERIGTFARRRRG